MKKVSSRKHDRFGRVLDSDPVYLIAALALMALLVSFYAVLLVNMNAIDTKTEDLKEHPYAVTVAAGRAETLLMQVRTLDNRLAFARTPERYCQNSCANSSRRWSAIGMITPPAA